MLRCIILILLTHGTVTEETCDNECYQNVEKGLENFSDLYKNPPNISKIPPSYPDIVLLINRTQEILSNIPDLKNVCDKTKSINDTIIKQNNKLNKLKKAVLFLEKLKEKLEKLNRKKEVHDETIEECVTAKNKYKTLKDEVEEIKEKGRKLNETYGKVTDKMNQINKASMDIKKDFDVIMVPDSALENYMCNAKFESTIQDIIDTGKNATNTLKLLKGHIFKQLKAQNDANKKVIDDISALDTTLPEPPLNITEETMPLLQSVKKQIDDLKDKLKNIKLSDNNLKEISDKNDERLKEFEKILKLIFSKRNRKRVEQEIKKARQFLDLLDERSKVKAEFEEIKQIVDHLHEQGVCNIVDAQYEP